MEEEIKELYDRYEEVLFERDEILKEADQIWFAYLNEFGVKMSELFEKKISCIGLKKRIAFCQTKINHNKSIDIDQLNDEMERYLAEYNHKLHDMKQETELAKSGEAISKVTHDAVKRLYRKLAKKIHPDINPKTEKNYDLSVLWLRLLAAYNNNDLKEMMELDFLISKALEDEDDLEERYNVDEIENQIAAIESEIQECKTSEPYIFTIILDDEDEIAEKHRELDEEIVQYSEYEKELDQVYKQLILKAGVDLNYKLY